MDFDDWLKIITLGAAIIGAAKAIAEYRRSNNWKMAEFASAHISSLQKDDELEFACFLLEYAQARLLVPQRYRQIIGADTIEHTSERVEKALERKLDYAEVKSHPDILLYRNTMDRLLGHFAATTDMLEQKLFNVRHVLTMSYYVNRAMTFPHARNLPSDAVFQPYMEEFGYLARIIKLKRLFDEETAKQP
jgi:hypothetical protein